MIEFSLFGIRVRVEPFFWLFLAFIGGALHARNAAELLGVAMFVLAGFFSVLIHELGHALTIRMFGLPTEIVLTTMGGYATYPTGVLTRKKSFIVTAAGPLVQLVFGGLVYTALLFTPPLGGQLEVFFKYFILVSIVWALFNCLPIYPLDGGQMLGAIMGPRRAKALYMTGVITAVIVGLVALKFGFIFAAMFMGYFGYQNYLRYKAVTH